MFDYLYLSQLSLFIALFTSLAIFDYNFYRHHMQWKWVSERIKKERETCGMTLISCFCHTFLWCNLVATGHNSAFLPLFSSSSYYVSHILHSHARDNAIEIEFYLSDDMEMNLSHKRTCVCMRLTTFKSFPFIRHLKSWSYLFPWEEDDFHNLLICA